LAGADTAQVSQTAAQTAIVLVKRDISVPQSVPEVAEE